MAMDAFMHPRGPLPPGVYWRRRVALLALVVVALALVLRSCGGATDPDRLSAGASPTPSASPTRGPAASPSTSASPGRSPSASASPSPRRAGGPCGRADLRLTATSDAETYAAGVRPRLTLRVANAGSVACTADVGQAARELRVHSGNDRVWSSDDCSPGGQAQVETLDPGEAMTFAVTWARRRSAPGCPANRAEAAAGTYRVIGRLGDITAPGSVFRLL